MRYRIAITLALVLLAPSVSRAQSVTVGVLDAYTTRPTDTSISFGDVYGYVTFESNLKSPEGINQFLNTLIDQKFATNAEGSFLVTLALSQSPDAKPLVERPIISATRKANKFLWVTTKQSTTGDIDINGTLLNGSIVQNDINNLRVAFKVYKSDKITFDTKSYADLLTLADAARAAASLVAIPQLITGNTDTIAKLLDTVLSKDNSQQLTLASEMSFINVNGVGKQAPNKQRFTVTSKSKTANAVFWIDVYFGTRPSSLGGYDPTKVATGRKGFADWALPTKFIESAKVQVGTDKVKVSDMIEKTGPKTIATAWTMLNTSAYDASKNANVPIESVCRSIYDLVRTVFSERDAVGLYWDILHELKSNLAKTTGAKECVDAKRALFVYHGLELASLADIKN